MSPRSAAPSVAALLLLFLVAALSTGGLQRVAAQTATVQAEENVVSVTAGRSCAAVSRGLDGKLQCSGGEATTIELRMSPGDTTQLTLFTLLPAGAKQSLQGLRGQDPDAPPQTGDEYATSARILQITAVQSEVVAGHNMQAVGDPVPFGHVCLYSPVCKRTNGGSVDNPDVGSARPLPGKSVFFVAGADPDMSFYSTVRIRTLFANQPIVSSSGQTTFSSDASMRNWGDGVSPNSNTNGAEGCIGVLKLQALLDDLAGGASTVNTFEYGSVFMSGDFVAATSRETQGQPGIFNCGTGTSCVAMPNDIERGYNSCDDPTYGADRSIECSIAMQFVGGLANTVNTYFSYYQGGILDLEGNTPAVLPDDEDDDDSFVTAAFIDNDADDSSDQDDDESNGEQGGEICTVLQDAVDQGVITREEAFAFADDQCDCGYDKTDTSLTPYNVSFDDCEPTCKVGNDGDDTTGSLNDLNLQSLNGKISRRKGGAVYTPDDDHDSESSFTDGGAGASCQTCNSGTRAYCPEWCLAGFAQDFAGTPSWEGSFIGNPAGRALAGTLPVPVPFTVGYDNGGLEGDDDNSGLYYSGCLQDCENSPFCTDPIAACVDLSRYPGEDDGDGEEERTKLTGGSWVTQLQYWMLPAYDPHTLGLAANAANKWFSDTPPGIRPPPISTTFGDTQDLDYASIFGIGDQDNPNGADTYPQGTHIAATPPNFCFLPLEQYPDDGDPAPYFQMLGNANAIPEVFICPEERFSGASLATIQQACNRPHRSAYQSAPEAGDNPYDYEQFPGYICRTGHFDRTGAVAVDQLRYTSSQSQIDDNENPLNSRISAHYTCDAVAHMGPYGTAYDVDEKPFLIYKTDFFVEDITQGISDDDRLPRQHLTVSSYTDGEDPDAPKATDFNDDFTIAAKIGALESSDGFRGSYLDLSIVIFNATADGMPGPPAYPYRMAGPISVAEAAFTDFYSDVITQENDTLFWESGLTLVQDSEDPGVAPGRIKNSDFIGIIWLPQILRSLPGAYDQRDLDKCTDNDDTTPCTLDTSSLTNKFGSFPMAYSGAARVNLHSGWRGLMMPVDFYGNSANAQRVGEAGACASVIGYAEGAEEQITRTMHEIDFNIRNAQSSDFPNGDPRYSTLRDPDHTSGDRNRQGAWIRGYRDNKLGLEVSPAVTTGRLVDALGLDSGNAMVNYLNRFGALPQYFFPGDCAGEPNDKCDLPTQIIQSDVYLHKDPLLQGTDISILSTLSLSNTILAATTQAVVPGKFITDPPPGSAPVCGVAANSAMGQISIDVENLGTLAAEFRVTADCGSGVTAGASQDRTIKPGATATFTLPLSHSGPILPLVASGETNGTTTATPFDDAVSFTCELTLSPPVAADPQFFWEKLDIDSCVLTGVDTDADITSYLPGGLDVCAQENADCSSGNLGDGGETGVTPEEYFWTLVTILLVIIAFLFVIMIACACLSTQIHEKAAKARLQGAIAGVTE